MERSKVFVQPVESSWTDLGGGIKRRILGNHEELMMVEVSFEAGAIGAEHSHPHIQVSYVASGKFEFDIGGEKSLLSQGDSFMVPSDVTHSCRAIEGGVLIDSFTPHRADFL